MRNAYRVPEITEYRVEKRDWGRIIERTEADNTVKIAKRGQIRIPLRFTFAIAPGEREVSNLMESGIAAMKS